MSHAKTPHTETTHAIEPDLFRLLFSKETPKDSPFDAQGTRVYRRQIRLTISSSVLRGMPIAIALMGEPAIQDIVDTWLEREPPTTRLYWQLPVVFAEWLMTADDLDVPLALRELIHWETLEISVLNAANPSGPRPTLSPGAPDATKIQFDPSLRLAVYHHPVHELTKKSPGLPEAPTPSFLLMYRRNEAAHYRTVAPELAQIVAHMSGGESLASGLAFLRGLYGDALDEGRWRSELVRLAHLGILGFVPLAEPTA